MCSDRYTHPHTAMHLRLKHLVAIILCNLYFMVQKLIIAYIFVFSYRYSVACK